MTCIEQTFFSKAEKELFLDFDWDPEQARRDNDMKKNLALLAKYFKKLYKPTNNNLQTSSNSRNKTEDTTPVCSAQKGYSALTARDLDTMPGNAGSQSGVKRLRKHAITRRKWMMSNKLNKVVPLQLSKRWLEDTDKAELAEQRIEVT
ncbi:hypothetical protein Tco_1057386 [Tanacetum coccineum]|uniref:Uncharacterized protein n=1 Tax=Tanacetum coccineum TaxID=301880 RepID=A0ABQ5H600_9ASTR